MEPKLIEKERMLLAGYSFYGDPFRTSDGWTEENEIGRLWRRFMAYLEKNGGQLQHRVDEGTAYEVHLYSEETFQMGYYEVFVGIEVSQLNDLPIDLLAKVLPACTYAVFTLQGEQITSDWHQTVLKDWMARSGFGYAHNFMIELYDQRFRGLNQLEESELDILIPVKQARARP